MGRGGGCGLPKPSGWTAEIFVPVQRQRVRFWQTGMLIVFLAYPFQDPPTKTLDIEFGTGGHYWEISLTAVSPSRFLP